MIFFRCYKRWSFENGEKLLVLYHLFVLALVQGFTEFLPISSSGHLVLTGKLLGWSDQGLAIDVAVHLGTLLAVMLYFWRDLWMMMVGIGKLCIGRTGVETRMLINVIVATIPVVIAGYLLQDTIEAHLRDVRLIAWATIGFGVLLWIADKVGLTVWRVEHLTLKSAFLIGCAQVLALIPGTSRSGITMTAARFLGMERSDSARFSMLMSIPTIAAAGMLIVLEIMQSDNVSLEHDMILAAALAFVAGFLSIFALMAWLKRATYTPFVLYRILLGGGLLAWVYLG